MSDAPREAIKVVRDILKAGLGLKEEQIVLANQKWKIPTDGGLYVVLGYVGPSKAIGVSSYSEDDGSGGSREVAEGSFFDVIQIDLLSLVPNFSARTRANEATLILSSMASQKAQDENNVSIGRVSGWADTSSLESAQMVNRFTATVHVTSFARREAAVDYFDTLQGTEVHANA